MIDRSSIKIEAKGILRTARVSPLLVAAVVIAVQFILERIVTLVETGSLFFYNTYADKEGFLRSTRSLTQTAGRAARHVNGKVIMYADQITRSMQETIDETNYRREKQLKYNAEHHITPKQIKKTIDTDLIPGNGKAYIEEEHRHLVADPVTEYMSKADIKKIWESTKAAMQKAAKELDFLEAARLRDEMYMLEEKLK